jgi:hypothetical protein
MHSIHKASKLRDDSVGVRPQLERSSFSHRIHVRRLAAKEAHAPARSLDHIVDIWLRDDALRGTEVLFHRGHEHPALQLEAPDRRGLEQELQRPPGGVAAYCRGMHVIRCAVSSGNDQAASRVGRRASGLAPPRWSGTRTVPLKGQNANRHVSAFTLCLPSRAQSPRGHSRLLHTEPRCTRPRVCKLGTPASRRASCELRPTGRDSWP